MPLGLTFGKWSFIILCPTCGPTEAVGNPAVKYVVEINVWPRAWLRGRVNMRLHMGKSRKNRARAGSRKRII